MRNIYSRTTEGKSANLAVCLAEAHPSQPKSSIARVSTQVFPIKTLKCRTDELLKRIAQVVDRLQPYSSVRSSKEGIAHPPLTGHILVSCSTRFGKQLDCTSAVRWLFQVANRSVCSSKTEIALQKKEKKFCPQLGLNQGPPGFGSRALPLSY